MKPKIRDYFSKEFIKFFLVSTFAALINFGSRIYFSSFTKYPNAIALAFCCGLFVAFLLNKRLVFKNGKQKVLRQFIIFFVVNIGGLLQTLAVALLLREWFFPSINFYFHIDEISHLIGVGIPLFTNYFAHKYFSFR